VKIKDVEVGKTYRPVGVGFLSTERRVVKYVGDRLIVYVNEHGIEAFTTTDSYAEYEEIVPWFEVGKTYRCVHDRTVTYEITKVDLVRRKVNCIERSVLTDIDLQFPLYSEV
jgi:hypothetical protein